MSGDSDSLTPGAHKEAVESPFAHVTGVAPQTRSNKTWLIVGLIVGVILLIAAVGAGIYLGRSSSDSFRTVKDFPADDYFTDYHTVAGGTFKADATVEVDLGWKEETGRLMVFSTGEDVRRFAVLLPPALSDIHFYKGQRYRIVFKVLEGGLLYASSCSKL